MVYAVETRLTTQAQGVSREVNRFKIIDQWTILNWQILAGYAAKYNIRAALRDISMTHVDFEKKSEFFRRAVLLGIANTRFLLTHRDFLGKILCEQLNRANRRYNSIILPLA